MVTFDLASFNAEHEEFLGVATWWTIYQGSVILGQVENALRAEGLATDLVKEPSPKKAFSRAAKKLDKDHRNVFARKIRDGADRAVVGIVRESADAVAETLDYDQQVTAHLNKESGTLTTYQPKDGNGGDAVAKEFQESFDEFRQVLTDADLRLMVREVIRRAGGVPLRQSGGIYFIPKSEVGTMVRVDGVLRRLGLGQMYFMRVPDGVSEKNIAWTSAEQEIRERVERILIATDRIEKRAKCLVKQEARFKEVERLFEAYQELTEAEEQADNLRDYLREAGGRIAEKLAELQAAQVS